MLARISSVTLTVAQLPPATTEISPDGYRPACPLEISPQRKYYVKTQCAIAIGIIIVTVRCSPTDSRHLGASFVCLFAHLQVLATLVN